MQEKRLFPYYYKYSIACAIAYIIPVYFFFKHETFSELWLLYVGNCCFGLLLLISGIFVNRKLHSAASLRSLIMPGIKVIAVSIILICVLLGVLALTFKTMLCSRRQPTITDYFLVSQ